MARTVNKKDLNLEISKLRLIEKKAKQIAEKKLEESKAILINEFVNHPVSKEISDGPSANNVSGTLGGYGNLFSFIGFNAGQNPVTQWVNILKDRIRITKIEKSNGEYVGYSFRISGITDNELSQARMPWEGGKSWILAIERGISGFSFYVSKALGRSGGGVQSNNKIRGGSYSAVSYWSKMWQNFTKNLNK
jgi:hypothetical protein